MIPLREELEKRYFSTETISEAEILCLLPYELHEEWDNFMRGKTCPVLDNGDHGVYSWDLKQFLSKI
jgi:hypothetical protein